MVVIVLIDHGSKIQKSKELLKLTFGMSSKPAGFISAKYVESIIIDANVSITSGAFSLIRKYEIMVYWHDYQEIGMFLLPQYNNGMANVRKNQYLAVHDHRGFEISKSIVIQSCKNRLITIKKIGKNKNDLNKPIKKTTKKITKYLSDLETLESVNIADVRDTLMGIEANITKKYYEILRKILKKYEWEFGPRSRRPALDKFNALLNYGYAILKSQITQFIVVSGLDLYAGFLHVDRSGRESLVLDLMEEFRQIIVDETILELIMDDKLIEDKINAEDEIELKDEEKQLLINALFSKLDEKHGKTTLKRHLLLQSRKLSNFLVGNSLEYKPFKNKVR